MRLTSITITNLAGFSGEVNFNLPSLGILEGKHGAGKSSLEAVLMYCFGRRPLATKGSRAVQHDPAMLHAGAESGTAVITFDEEIDFLRVVVKPDATSRQVKMHGAKKWEDAGALIDDITNALAYNPMAFRDLSEKERLEAFLRVVPVDITPGEVAEAVGGVIPIPDGKIGLDTINSLYDDIFKSRTTENQNADRLAKHAAELTAALPVAGDATDWTAEVQKLRSELEVLNNSEQDEIKRIGKEFQDKKDANAKIKGTAATAFENEVAAQIESIDEEIKIWERKKATLKENLERQKVVLAEKEVADNEVARNTGNREAKEIRDANAPLREDLTTKIATAEERSRGAAQATGTRQAIDTATAGADGHKQASKLMTEALGRLSTLKASIAGRMKIKGVTIAAPRENMPVDICREENGKLVPFSSWNDADRDSFALRIAMLYRGTCGLVCIDNMGNWSAARRESIIKTCRKYAKEAGMQFLLGQATDAGELSIRDITEG